MKKYYLPELSFKLSTIFLLMLVLFIIHSCKKESTYQDIGLDKHILQARSWYETTYSASTGRANSINKLEAGTAFDYSQYTKPDWQHTASYKRFNKNVIEMPIDPANPVLSQLKNSTDNKAYADKENSRSSFLILNDGAGYHAYIMTVIGDAAYLKGDPGKLKNNTYSHRDTDFSGMVFYFTPKGQYINGYAYKNGRRLNSASAGAQTSATMKTTGAKLQLMELSCVAWYMGHYVDGELVSYDYMYTICTGDDGEGGGGGTPVPPPLCPPGTTTINPGSKLQVMEDTSGGETGLDPDGGDGFPPPDNPPSSQCTAPVVPKIIDKLTDPCLKAVLQKLQGSDLTGKVANIINNVFGSSDHVNITFLEFNDPNGKPAKSDPPTISNGIFNENIYMNLALDAGGSQEYNAEVMIHEILHSYMNYNNQNYLNQLAQHQQMADKYIGSMKSLLQQLFPGFSDPDAYSIILQGFSDIFQGSIPLYYDALKTEFGVTDPTLKTYYKYQLGQSGTLCN